MLLVSSGLLIGVYFEFGVCGAPETHRVMLVIVDKNAKVGASHDLRITTPAQNRHLLFIDIVVMFLDGGIVRLGRIFPRTLLVLTGDGLLMPMTCLVMLADHYGPLAML